MFALKISGDAIAAAFAPCPAITSSGLLLESHSPQKSFLETVGKVAQLIPLAFGLYVFLEEKLPNTIFWHGISSPSPFRNAQAHFWAPKIATVASLTFLLSPFIFKGLQKIAHKCNCLLLTNLLDRAEKIFMTAVKAVNIVGIVLGLILAIESFHIPLIALYSVFLIVNTWPLFGPLLT